MLTSTHNARIRRIRSLISSASERRQENAFVIEGVRLVEEALAANWEFEWLLFTEDVSERGMRLVEQATHKGINVDRTTAHVLQSISDTQSPQGLLAVLSMRSLPLPPSLDFILAADGVRDPGNLGTILRSAKAAGAQAVLLTPGSVDPFAPKVLRAAMGAHFRLPIRITGRDELLAFCRSGNIRVFLADAMGGVCFWNADFKQSLAIVIGGEAEGIDQQAYTVNAQTVFIPMAEKAESLNAAVAAALLCYEVVRQRYSEAL